MTRNPSHPRAVQPSVVLRLIFTCLTALLWLCGISAEASGKKDAAPASTAPFFDAQTVRKFKISITGPELEAIKRDNRTFVRATVTVDDVVLQNVGVHLKGHGSFRPLNENPSFTIKFDQFVLDQKYCGFGTLWLNNSTQDGTLFNEMMCRQMYRDAGLPTPRVTHIRVEFNGKPLGIYILMEPLNKQFLRQYFKYAGGNLYKTYVMDVDADLIHESGPDPNRNDLKELFHATQEKDKAVQWKKLNELMDVNQFLKYCAVEMITSHWDGYVLNRNNYFLYHDPESGRFVIFTHDLDSALNNLDCGLTPPPNFHLTRAVFQHPEARRQYREILPMLVSNVFQLDVLTNRLNSALARLCASTTNAHEIKDFESRAKNLGDRIIQRSKNMENILAKEPRQLTLKPGEKGPLAYWGNMKESGNPVMDCVPENGKPALHIKSESSGCTSSWRTRVCFLPGKYRLQATVRTEGMGPAPKDASSGAAVFIIGKGAGQRITTNAPIIAIQQEFEVKDEETPVEFSCEVRLCKGNVWFPLDTLQVLRLN